MEIRQLDGSDLDALAEFIVGAYREYPIATWFSSEPGRGEIEGIFYNKIKGIGLRTVVDIVCEDGGAIVGECEIVRIANNAGVVGIMVRRGQAGRHIGSRILDSAIKNAGDIGMTEFRAEVDRENKDAVKFFIDRGFSPEGYEDIEQKGGRKRSAAVLKLRI